MFDRPIAGVAGACSTCEREGGRRHGRRSAAVVDARQEARAVMAKAAAAIPVVSEEAAKLVART